MTDLTKRLRHCAKCVFLIGEAEPCQTISNQLIEAADEIDRLSAALEGERRRAQELELLLLHGPKPWFIVRTV